MIEKFSQALKVVKQMYDIVLTGLSCVLCIYGIVAILHIIAFFNSGHTKATVTNAIYKQKVTYQTPVKKV